MGAEFEEPEAVPDQNDEDFAEDEDEENYHGE
jgi:hypothetical protein